MKDTEQVEKYAAQMVTQMRKGLIAYCVLRVCSRKPVYTSDIIRELRRANLVVAEGTVYPLLSRLQKDGLLSHEWQESEQGPPRKYYKITEFGEEIAEVVGREIQNLNQTIQQL